MQVVFIPNTERELYGYTEFTIKLTFICLPEQKKTMVLKIILEKIELA